MNGINPKQIILEGLASILKPRGYRRRGSLFACSAGEVIHLVGLQSSSSSTASMARLTVNLAVWVPSLEEPDTKPAVGNAHWRERLGMLMRDRADRWWTISSKQDAETASAEIAAAVQEVALPHLAGLCSIAALLVLWQSGRSPGLTDFQRARYAAALRTGQF